MVCGDNSQTPFVDLGSQYIKPTVTNRGVKVDAELQFESQIMALIKSSFLQVLSVFKPLLKTHLFSMACNICDMLIVLQLVIFKYNLCKLMKSLIF